jgi:hypothetical protein
MERFFFTSLFMCGSVAKHYSGALSIRVRENKPQFRSKSFPLGQHSGHDCPQPLIGLFLFCYFDEHL